MQIVAQVPRAVAVLTPARSAREPRPLSKAPSPRQAIIAVASSRRRSDRAFPERAWSSQPADGGLRHTVGPRQIGLHSAFPEAVERLAALMRLREGGRPNFTPFAFARALPSPVRARMRLRS